ncbi:hypothetical protein AtubIFM57258_001268 [Aspergillus tubingensis]|nr:hypothetical protein AtubIFM57258_001268 [Aspergillus tubingensis]
MPVSSTDPTYMPHPDSEQASEVFASRPGDDANLLLLMEEIERTNHDFFGSTALASPNAMSPEPNQGTNLYPFENTSGFTNATAFLNNMPGSYDDSGVYTSSSDFTTSPSGTIPYSALTSPAAADDTVDPSVLDQSNDLWTPEPFRESSSHAEVNGPVSSSNSAVEPISEAGTLQTGIESASGSQRQVNRRSSRPRLDTFAEIAKT